MWLDKGGTWADSSVIPDGIGSVRSPPQNSVAEITYYKTNAAQIASPKRVLLRRGAPPGERLGCKRERGVYGLNCDEPVNCPLGVLYCLRRN